jgi:hypothetical protein
VGRHGGARRARATASPPREPESATAASAHAAERGTALVATLLLGFVLAGVTAVAGHAARETSAEVRVRRDVLCAHYAALAGVALGPSAVDRADQVDAAVDSLLVALVARAPGWCVVRSTARCRDARRTLERTVAPAACGG